MSTSTGEAVAPVARALSLVPRSPDAVSGQAMEQSGETEKLIPVVESLLSRISEIERKNEELAQAISELKDAVTPAPPLLDPQYSRRFRRTI